ncbi:MAG: hypothetical protein WAQ05_15935 [Rubrivivax sp.]
MTRFDIHRRAVAGLLLATACGLAAAQPATPRSYAVLSEFAREINVVTFQESTGTRLNNNLRTSMPMPNGALDKVALVATRTAVQKAEPGAGLWLIAPLDTDLFPPTQVFSEGTVLKLPEDVAGEMKKRGHTHLLLLTRLRAEAELKALRSSEGTGPLEGLGFFVDRVTAGRNADTGQFSTGFLAPYMHARVILVDAASGRVVGIQRIKHSVVYSTARAEIKSTDAWDVMKPDEKVRYLANMIEREIGTAVPALLNATR